MKIMDRVKWYYSLTKPGIARMQLVTVSIGFFVARVGVLTQGSPLFPLLAGTWLVASGAGALNHFVERDVDALMERTKNRAIPSRKIPPTNALILGILLCLLGVYVHWRWVNELTALLSFLTVFLYIIVYTPLKRVTWLNTFVGSFPGALPVLGGWAAATKDLHPGAWILFFVLFAWQHPHFYALAIMYRDDYRRGGLVMLPVLETDLKRTVRQTVLYTFLMFVASILPFALGASGSLYLAGMVLAGVAMLVAALRLAATRSEKDARRLFLTSILYLPIWFILIVVDFYVVANT